MNLNYEDLQVNSRLKTYRGYSINVKVEGSSKRKKWWTQFDNAESIEDVFGSYKIDMVLECKPINNVTQN